MAIILIASDLKDDYVTKTLPDLLKQAGHTSEVVHPLEQTAKFIRATCVGLGGFDLGLLVQSTRDSIGQDSPYRVASQVRAIPDKFAFRNAVKGRSLPLLVVGKEVSKSLDSVERHKLVLMDWVSLYDHEPPDGVTAVPLTSAVNELIFKWRTSLLRELECVGYAVILGGDGTLSVNPTFKKADVEGEILAPNTDLNRLRHSGYLIVSSDVCRAAESYRELAYLVDNFRTVAKAKETKPEEVFQTFFSRNPDYLFQQSFAELWPKPRLPLPEDFKKWLEPDFVVKPAVSPQIGSKWKVLDIKLPDVKLTKGSKFHPTFSAKLQAAIQQVADYRKYFARSDAATHLQAVFGFQPRNPQLAVLIGRKLDVEEAQLLDHAFESTQTLRVEIITYDEVLDERSLRIAADLHWLKRLT